MNRLTSLWTELCTRTDYESCSRPRAARFRLDTIQELLKRLQSPQLAVPALHIAGSKGKGTVCHYLERGLRAAGFCTGLYTSPHLSDWRERILVDGQFAADELLADAFAAVLEASSGEETFFDLLTASAMLVFQNSACDIMVLETGLGGRFDSTNVVVPLAAAVTSIELEHVDVLGADLATIAGEKAGIFKPGAALWCGRNMPASALAVLQQQAARCGEVLHIPAAEANPFAHPQAHMGKFGSGSGCACCFAGTVCHCRGRPTTTGGAAAHTCFAGALGAAPTCRRPPCDFGCSAFRQLPRLRVAILSFCFPYAKTRRGPRSAR